MEGWLAKEGSLKKSNWHKRYFVLSEGHLDYYDKKPDWGKKNHPKKRINLINCKVYEKPQVRSGCFAIRDSEKNKEHRFIPLANGDMKSWVNAIQNASKGFSSSPRSVSPVPDRWSDDRPHSPIPSPTLPPHRAPMIHAGSSPSVMTQNPTQNPTQTHLSYSNFCGRMATRPVNRNQQMMQHQSSPQLLPNQSSSQIRHNYTLPAPGQPSYPYQNPPQNLQPNPGIGQPNQGMGQPNQGMGAGSWGKLRQHVMTGSHYSFQPQSSQTFQPPPSIMISSGGPPPARGQMHQPYPPQGQFRGPPPQPYPPQGPQLQCPPQSSAQPQYYGSQEGPSYSSQYPDLFVLSPPHPKVDISDDASDEGGESDDEELKRIEQRMEMYREFEGVQEEQQVRDTIEKGTFPTLVKTDFGLELKEDEQAQSSAFTEEQYIEEEAERRLQQLLAQEVTDSNNTNLGVLSPEEQSQRYQQHPTDYFSSNHPHPVIQDDFHLYPSASLTQFDDQDNNNNNFQYHNNPYTQPTNPFDPSFADLPAADQYNLSTNDGPFHPPPLPPKQNPPSYPPPLPPKGRTPF